MAAALQRRWIHDNGNFTTASPSDNVGFTAVASQRHLCNGGFTTGEELWRAAASQRQRLCNSGGFRIAAASRHRWLPDNGHFTTVSPFEDVCFTVVAS